MAPAKKKPAAKKVPARRPAKAIKKAGSNPDAAAQRRRLFAQAYIANGGNMTEAAKAAGFSERTAYAQGSRLFKHVEVQALIQQGAAKVARKYELTTDMVVRSIVQELTFDPALLYDQHGRLRPITQLDEDTRAALQGVEITEEVIGGGEGKKDQPLALLRTAKVKWAPKQGAREQAMKHLGMFKEDNAQRTMLEGISREMLKLMFERLKGG